MFVYRIAKKAFIRDLAGTGARLYGGRWNRAGTAILYTAETRSLAALEYLVHVNIQLVPSDLCIAELELPDGQMETVDISGLPEDWSSFPPPDILADITGKWKQDGRTLSLRVPSAVITGEWNILVNPEHPQAKAVSLSCVEPFLFDSRLLSHR